MREISDLRSRIIFRYFSGTTKVKGKGFVVKGVVLFGMGVLAIFGAAVLFAAGYHFLLGKRGDWHAVCAADGDTDFRKCAVVSGAFVPESDLSKDRIPVRGRGAVGGVALFLTGLGEGRWQFFPATWSARGIRYCNDPVNGKRVLFCLLLLFLMCVIIGVWFHKYEGRQCND